jgi:hypothetical protein
MVVTAYFVRKFTLLIFFFQVSNAADYLSSDLRRMCRIGSSAT